MNSPILPNQFTEEVLFNQSPTPIYNIVNPFKIRHNYSHIEDILNKSYLQRNHKQLMILSKFVNQNQWLSKIVQQFGLQIAKGLMRNAKIQELKPKMIISQVQEPIQGVVVVLQGKLGIYKIQKIQNFNQVPKNQVFQRLMQTVRLQNKQKKKKKVKQQKKPLLRKSSFNSEFKYHSKVRIMNNQEEFSIGILEQQIKKDEDYGLKQRIKTKLHSNNVVTLQKTIILYLSIDQVFNWLNYSFQQKLMQSFSLVRQIECFKIFDDQEIQAIIQCMTIRKKLKGEYIYKQNQQVKFIYFLSQGEAKIIKQSNLFVDDPNSLYCNRQKLIEQFQIQIKQKKLPYASLSTLYNYRPTKKNIQLSVIGSFCMFGQEQIFSKKHQTNVIVNSLQAYYYELSLSKFINFLYSKYQLFQKEVLKFCKQKIIKRQQIFSQALNMENKLHLDYFYIDQTDFVRQIPKKYRLQKLNKKLNPTYSKSKTKLNIQTQDQDNINTEETQTIDNQLNPEVTNNLCIYQSKEKLKNKPNITTFNFHKTLLYPKLKPVDLSLYSTKSKLSSPKSTRTQQNKNSSDGELNQIQSSLFGNSHTWSIQKQIVKRQKEISKMISPLKQKISFSRPLFDQKQLQKQEQRSLRIERERRKIILKGYGQTTKNFKRVE